ncbi:Switch 2 [Gracilariopsis chorda]|uniref:Switch 2 n=1 Tax=Gracilariopsis chorda TaxID=448386 RepID=A0A2V3IYJ3_9FLOR|nr:Switch 2 [Gracilariopsis chorda]|eukprot:PXF47191.1 Switch 2 [Gracilariopsis chorda]
MDDEQKRDVFRSLFATRAPSVASASASASLTSTDQSEPPTPPPEPLPRTTRPSPARSYASSDAETVEPEPEHLRLTENVQLPRPNSASVSLVTAPVQSRPSTANPPPSEHSISSSAETVPPPSPGALERLCARTATDASTPAPRVAAVEERGIDGWEADQASALAHENAYPRRLGHGYPKLTSAKFDSEVQDDLQLSNRTTPPASFGILPATLLRYLSPFQQDGIMFLYRLYERGRGGLLADAMGLGKTVQTVCFLGAAFAVWDRDQRVQNLAEQAPRVLVVAPVSVKENWRREFETWTPFKVDIYDKNRQPEISRALQNQELDILISGDNPIASYGSTFFSNPSKDPSGWKWDIVIVDEIHIAKNCNTKIYKSLSSLPRRVMFGLTGTAVQNRLKELWNVMSLVVPPSLWPSYPSFRGHFIDIINRGTKKDASDYMRGKANERIASLRNLLAKHMVRRPKSIIKNELPGKTDYCVFMRMKRNGLQAYMYEKFQNSYDVKLLRDAHLPCDCGSEYQSRECCHRFPATEEYKENAPIWKMHHKNLRPCERCPNCLCFYLQHISRAIATHAFLLLPEEDESDPEKKKARHKLFNYYVGIHAEAVKKPLTTLEREADVSCKLSVALKLLKSYEQKGHKTIIFYESIRLGDILQRWATNNGLVFEVIDGSVTNGRRQIAVDRFNANPLCSIFFISKKSGGTGLNISGADRVLIFEPCWNPTLDLQAGDRAHRLGQRRCVDIVRLVVENTIEHYVWNTAISKSQVSSAILDNTKEDWLVRENEIGSMQAMLQMGEKEQFMSGDTGPDDFRVEKAEQVSTRSVGNGDSSNLIAVPRTSSDEQAKTEDDESREVDVLGESIVCALDVDLGEDRMSPNPNRCARSNSEGSEADVEKSFIASESQFETDVVLQEGGASSKFVVTSTHGKKRSRQVMGLTGAEDSGINPEGPVGINFDDAKFRGMSKPTSDEEISGEDGDIVVRKKRRRKSPRQQNPRDTHNASRGVRIAEVSARGNATKQARKKVVVDKKGAAPATKGLGSNPTAKSVFKARARVRRPQD